MTASLYEAQDHSLCESVAQQLQQSLILSRVTLTPSDCLCIGYFLAHVCKMALGKFRVELSSCSIGDQGCKYLVSGLHKFLNARSVVTTRLIINLGNNVIRDQGVQYLSILLNGDCIYHLDLGNSGFSHERNQNLISLQGIIMINVLYYRYPFYTHTGEFAKQLKNVTTLKALNLRLNGLTSWSVEGLIEVLTVNKHLLKVYGLTSWSVEGLIEVLTVNKHLLKV